MNIDIANALRMNGTPSCPDLSHQVRKLGFFKESFATCADAMAGHLGTLITVDSIRLTRAFLDWREDFLRQSAAADVDRRDYMLFSSGLMLCYLLRNQPITLIGADPDTRKSLDGAIETAAGFWPEGLIYTRYCLGILESVLDQEGEEPIHLSPLIGEVAAWWSFRENVGEDPARAIGVLDLFVGAEPNWEMPGLAANRPAIRRAGLRLAHERCRGVEASGDASRRLN